MAELITVARPYAEATFRAAIDAKDLAGIFGQLQLVAAVASDGQMSALLANPKVTPEKKLALFHSVTEGKLGEVVKNLVTMLVDNHRTVLLKPICGLFELLKNEHESMLKARIISAFPMSDGEKNDLVAALTKKYSKKVEADVVVDAALIGGVNIEIGDEVIHGSVRDTLNKMAIALAH
jgi:F-type H+-transporting ATPase subunit delta